jgi:hypothetical protein
MRYFVGKGRVFGRLHGVCGGVPVLARFSDAERGWGEAQFPTTSYLCAMQVLLNWLRRPFPFEEKWLTWLRHALIGGAFVAVFLFVFRPFGTSNVEVTQGEMLRMSLIYGIITVVAIMLWTAVVMGLPSYFNERDWNVGREIVSNIGMISVIAICNMLYSAWRFGNDISLVLLLNWLWVTAAVGIFPTMFGVFVQQMRLAKRYSAEAALLGQTPAGQPRTMGEATILLEGDNQNERLQISVEDLLYIEADDNYVTVFFNAAGGTQQRILRGTLRQMEAALAAHPQVFRCHRTYLVNLGRVQRWTGNAQGLRLHLLGTEQSIPVSRSLQKAIRSRIVEV